MDVCTGLNKNGDLDPSPEVIGDTAEFLRGEALKDIEVVFRVWKAAPEGFDEFIVGLIMWEYWR